MRILHVAAVVCLLGGMAAGAEPAIRIGVIAELTGDLPAVGASCKNAALMAVKEINDAGGIVIGGQPRRVELVIEDNASKADQSALCAQKLITQDRVLAILGPNASLGAIPAATIAESGKTVLLTPWSTNPKTTLDARTGKPKRWVFRACYTDAFEGRVLARFARDKLKAGRAAILYDVASEAPKSQADLFAASFTEFGGVLAARETYTTGDRDFSAQLTKIRKANPDIIFLPAYYNDVPLVVQQARRLGLQTPFLGSDAWSSPELIALAQGAVEGYHFANHYAADAATPVAQRFIQAYEKAYGKTPDDVAALTYDACGMLARALGALQKPDRAALRDALAALPSFEGVTGTLRFPEGSGDPIKSAVILQIRNGKFAWVANVAP